MMSTKAKSIKVKIDIDVQPDEVYTAFTNSAALRDWLCAVADADATPGGRLYLWWNNGFYAIGEYTALKPAEKIAFTWHGRNDPGQSTVRIAIQPQGEATHVNLHHEVASDGKSWKKTFRQIRKGWKSALQNLKSVLETGQDMRLSKRASLGIDAVSELDYEDPALTDYPYAHGLRVASIQEDSPAAQSGIMIGDVLIKIAGTKITNPEQLNRILIGNPTDEPVKVSYWRNGEKHSTMIVPVSQPLPAIPTTAEQLIETFQQQVAASTAQLDQQMTGFPSEQFDELLDAQLLGIAQGVAHLLISERELQNWISGLMEGQDILFNLGSLQTARIVAAVSTYNSYPELRKALSVALTETEAMLRHLPVEFVSRKRSFWRLSLGIMDHLTHFSLHINQMGNLISLSALPVNADAQPEPKATDKKRSNSRRSAKNNHASSDSAQHPG